MSGPALTVHEIANAPMIDAAGLKDSQPNTRSRLNFILCIVLVTNTLFQFIAIVTPGWNTVITSDTESYQSVYYTTGCATIGDRGEMKCKTTSNRKTYMDAIDKLDGDTDPSQARLVLQLSLRTRYEMTIQISWFIVVGTTVFQFLRYFKSTEMFPKLTVINAVILMVACSFMYHALYEVFSYIDYSRRISEISKTDVGFPYSLFLYVIAFVKTCASTVLIVKQTFDYMLYVEHVSTGNKVRYDTLKKTYDVEVEEFRRYRQSRSDESRLRPHSTASKNGDRRSYGNHSPRHTPRHSPRPSPRESPRPSPSSSPRLTRQQDERAHSRYMELLERSRHANSQDHSAPTYEHAQMSRVQSPAREEVPLRISAHEELRPINGEGQYTAPIKL